MTGSGHRRVLRYDVKPLEGQKITFFERGPSAGGPIGVARGAAGSLRFSPADGVAERRDVVAVVEQDGRPRAELKVATYAAPGPMRPARPQGVRVKRGRSLTVRWRRVRGATGYDVRVRLADGRRLFLRTSRRQVRVASVAPKARGRVSIRALSAAALAGRPATARLIPSTTVGR